MKNGKKHLFILSTILFSLMLPPAVTRAESAPIAADSARQSAETLTPEQCRAMALQYNKELAAAAQAAKSASFTAKSYKANFLPNITATGTGLYSTADGQFDILGYNVGYEVGTLLAGGLSVEQPIYMGGKINAAYRLAMLGKDIAQTQETLTATEVIQKTDEAYTQVVRAEEMMKVAEAYRSLVEELMHTVESAYRNGMKPKNDVLKVQVKLNDSELSLRKAENGLRLAKMNLCHYIGLPLTTDIAVCRELSVEQMLGGKDVLLSDIAGSRLTLDISGRPEYAILNRQVDIAMQEIKLNRSEMLPKIGVNATYNYVHGLEVNDKTLIDKGIFSAALNVSVPLFHFGEHRNKVRAAKAKHVQAQLEQQDMNEKMTLELSQALNNLDEAMLERDIADRSLKQAEENMRVSKKMYEAGMETLSDHLEAQTLWQQAYEQQVSAGCQLYLAYIAYRKAAGILYSEYQ